MPEVHPVDAGDQCRHDEDRAPRRHLLHHLVEPVGDHRELGVEQAGEQIALRFDQVHRSQHTVVDVVEVDDRTHLYERKLTTDDCVDHFAQRCHRPAKLHEDTPYGEDLASDLVVGLVGEDALFDVVEPLVERVGGVEVAVDDHVEQRPEQEAFLGAVVLGALELETVRHPIGVEAHAVVAGMTHSEDPALAQHDVDLTAREDVISELAVVDGDVEVVAVTLQLGALALVGEIVDHDLANVKFAAQLVELVAGRKRAVDPDHFAGRVERGDDTMGIDGLVPLDPGAVSPGTDHVRSLRKYAPGGVTTNTYATNTRRSKMATSLAQRTAEELGAEAPAWLRDNLPDGWIDAIDTGDDARFAQLRTGFDHAAWYTRFGESGYATPTWPAEYGAGLSLTPTQARAVNEVLDRYAVPRPPNIIGIGMGGPTVIAWGSEEQKHDYLRGIATNEEIWCQLFSEPGAGSDVAGLATQAVRDGDEWVVNGQKVWTSLAHTGAVRDARRPHRS